MNATPNCPTCGSPAPERHPAVQHEGEVQPCRDPFHLTVTPQNTPERIAETQALLERIFTDAADAEAARLLDDAYREGFRAGVTAYAYSSGEAWAENGVQYVGTTGSHPRGGARTSRGDPQLHPAERAMIDQAEFDAGLDRYQATLAEEAQEAADRSYVAAARPDAVPLETTFSDLRVGDYMTNEGPRGRWVEVVDLRGPACQRKTRQQRIKDDEVAVLFEIVEPVTVSGETRYWLYRPATEAVLVDASARA